MDVIWLKDGVPVSENSAKTTKLDELTVMLSLTRLSLGDAGIYTCVASNRAGSANHSSELRVKGRP